MKLRSLWLAAALAVTANHVAAQCPDTRVQTVPASHQQIGVQGCGIAELEVGGITIGGKGKTCPLLIIDTPAHELEVYAGPEAKTKAVITDTVLEWSYFFRCEQVWYAIIPLGSTCALDRAIVRSTLHRRTTASC